jgi:hypothetical protein
MDAQLPRAGTSVLSLRPPYIYIPTFTATPCLPHLPYLPFLLLLSY